MSGKRYLEELNNHQLKAGGLVLRTESPDTNLVGSGPKATPSQQNGTSARYIKRWLLGTHQGTVAGKHLNFYLDGIRSASIVVLPD